MRFAFPAVAAVGAVVLAMAGMILPAAACAGAAVIGMLLASAAGVRKRRAAMSYDELSGDARTLVRPLVRLNREIEELVDANPSSPEIKVIGGEAVAESRRLLEHATRLLRARSELKRAVESQRELRRNFGDKAEQLPDRSSEAVDAIAKIEAAIQGAQMSLTDMKTRLALASAGTQEFDHEGFRESLANLRALDASLDEAEEMTLGRLDG